jgi:hypothetical protein
MRNMEFFKEKVEELIRIAPRGHRPTGTASSGTNPSPRHGMSSGGKIEQELQTALRMDATKPIVVTSKEQAVTLQSMGGSGKTTFSIDLMQPL